MTGKKKKAVTEDWECGGDTSQVERPNGGVVRNTYACRVAFYL